MMAKELTPEENAWLQKLEASVDRYWDELTAFEKRFLEDTLERFRRYGARTIITVRQWVILTAISEKIL